MIPFQLRNRLPPRKVIKVRTRTRRPSHPASSTQAPEEENSATEEPRQNYRKLNRFNQDLYDNNEVNIIGGRLYIKFPI